MKLNLVHPFSREIARMVRNISVTALLIGLTGVAMSGYSQWLTDQGVVMDALQPFIEEGVEYLFLAGIVFVVSQIFVRGIEIQAENELTI